MSKRRTNKKDESKIDDIEMEVVDKNIKNTYNFNEQFYSKEIITTDVALRNLFHLGYNSKSLTKTIINSIKFEDVIGTIKSYIENDELSFKSCGPLVLGLTRVYDKQIKIFLDDLLTMFEIKRHNKSNKVDEDKENTKKSKRKGGVSNGNKSTLDNSIIKSHNSLFNSSSNNILSLSPLNEGLFSLLNNDSNSKNTTESKIKSPSIMEAFRAQNSAGLDSKSKFNLNSNMKNPIILESSAFDEENNEVNNFFQFISENVRREAGSEIPVLDFDIDAGLNNINNQDEITKQLIFPSDSKIMMNMELSGLKYLKKAEHKKSKKINIKFEYDHEINFDLEEAHKLFVKEDRDTIKKFKSHLRKADENNISNILTDNKLNILKSKKNDIFNTTFNNSYELMNDNFLNNFSHLDMKDFDFSENEFKEKLNKILEEEKKDEETKKISEEQNNFEDEFDNSNFNKNMEDNKNYEELVNEENKYELNQNNNDTALGNFAIKIENILKRDKGKKKDKTISFTSLKDELVDTIPPHQVFYNLLCLAQKDTININQKKIFDNGSIFISN